MTDEKTQILTLAELDQCERDLVEAARKPTTMATHAYDWMFRLVETCRELMCDTDDYGEPLAGIAEAPDCYVVDPVAGLVAKLSTDHCSTLPDEVG